MRGFSFFLALMVLIAGLSEPIRSFAQAPLPQSESVDQELTFTFPNLEEKPELRRQLRRMLLESREQIESQMAVQLTGPVIVVWATNKEFEEHTGFRPENSAAAASARLSTIWINESAWFQMPDHEKQQVLTHELGHLVLGNLPGGKQLPLWANEGIVMHLAGQMSWDGHLALLGAHFADSLPKLENLEKDFPRDKGPQTLAYRMSYTAIEQVARSYGDRPGSIRRLMARLADPVFGPAAAKELYDPYRREGWQLAAEQALGSRLTTGLVFLSSSGTIFLLIAIFFLIAYGVVRKKRGERDRQYEQETESWEESLTDADIQDIYGDREDRWD